MLMGFRLILCLLFMSQGAAAWAQQGGAFDGALDHELIGRFPGAEVVDYRTPGVTNYRLALDRMQRVNGRVSAGREERVNGTLTRITYKIPEGYSSADVFAHYSAQMLVAGAVVAVVISGRTMCSRIASSTARMRTSIIWSALWAVTSNISVPT